jgi:hypothetical protein
MCLSIYVRMCVSIHVRMCVSMYVRMCEYVCVCGCVGREARRNQEYKRVSGLIE